MADESTEPQEPTQQTFNQPDWFLQALVNMANSGNFTMGITLQVSGFLVSGELISGPTYFEGFATDFVSPMRDRTEAEKIRKTLSDCGELYKTDTLNVPLPAYIHLKQARFFNTAGNPIPGNRGVWWRGRISEVGGFVLGTLSHHS